MSASDRLLGGLAAEGERMSFRRGGAGKRRDAIESAVIEALNAYGWATYQVNGRALPDILCFKGRRCVALGIKSGEKARLTPSERDSPPPWPIVRSVVEALRELA